VAGETEIKDDWATWRDYPDATAPGESDGTLALKDSRLTFAPTGTGVVFDADLDGFESAEISRERSGRSLLTLHFLDGGLTTFWTSGDVALAVVDAVRTRF
jgi:hypothetical protein